VLKLQLELEGAPGSCSSAARGDPVASYCGGTTPLKN